MLTGVNEMSFRNQLIDYMNEIGCSSKDLSLACGLSTSSISRYRSGDRKPPTSSKHIRQIAEGLCKLARDHGLIDFDSPSRVAQNLVNSINKSPFIFDYTSFRKNFSELVQKLNIDQVAVSQYLGYDDVFVAGLLKGKRQPAEPALLVDLITEFVVKTHNSDSEKEILSEVTGLDIDDIRSEEDFYNALHYWLNTTQNDHRRSAATLVEAINAYDPTSAEIHFSSNRYDGVPLQNTWKELPANEFITDASLFPDAELAFIESLKDLEPGSTVFIYNDYSFRLLDSDSEHSDKWKYGLATALKKGITVNIVLNIDMPFKAVLANFEKWLPFFMTGHMFPYYVKGAQSSIFNHVLLVSDKCAIFGESVIRNHNFGTYCLMSDEARIAEMKERAALIMNKALPLLDIYSKDSSDEMVKRITNDIAVPGDKRAIVTSVPLFLANDSLIEKILENNDLPEEEKTFIRYICRAERINSDVALKSGPVDLSIVKFTKEAFEQINPCLLPYVRTEKEMHYSYEDYCEHLKQAEEYVSKKKNFRLTYVKNSYTNIQILVHRGKFVLVAKVSEPHTLFVMKHPKLFKAFEDMLFPEG